MVRTADPTSQMSNNGSGSNREQMNVVIVGHVDHGKSTVIGRLLADTGSLPEGKLKQVQQQCESNARPFEYAFLLDALKDEQAQGITIDTARCFFKTKKRDYIIHDAPGHIEFLKNMITGAARAEAALLVIDAQEGIQENSKRHGYMVSMLGVKHLAVLVNKMDLVDFSRERFESIRDEYSEFLERLGVHPLGFIPLSAREGVNLTGRSEETAWYDGLSVLEQVDAFTKPEGNAEHDFRMPVQDVYKFTADQDDRRIVAGTIDSGSIDEGDEVVFYPSGKESAITRVEGFNTSPRTEISAPYAAGFTLTTQIYIRPGELMCRKGQSLPHVGRRFRANMFWMGRPPMVREKNYKLKIGAANVSAQLADVISVLDASELSSVQGKQQIDRHDVAECVLETLHPVAFDTRNNIEPTGRFVIVDDYEIAGAGIILEPLTEEDSLFKEEIKRREFSWERGLVTSAERSTKAGHRGKFVAFVGKFHSGKRNLAKAVEKHLFGVGCQVYYFGLTNLTKSFESLDREARTRSIEQDDAVRRLGELARVMTDAGTLFMTVLTNVDDYDMEQLGMLNAPNELFVVAVGETPFSQFKADVELPDHPDLEEAVQKVVEGLTKKEVLIDYSI